MVKKKQSRIIKMERKKENIFIITKMAKLIICIYTEMENQKEIASKNIKMAI